jgi:large subunit ribosomal protein L17
MRHLKAGRKLNRNPAHRRSMMRNMACALIEHGKIETTPAKAKELRPFIERLITMARRGDLASKRLVVSRLGPTAHTPLVSEKANEGVEQAWKKVTVLKRLEERAKGFIGRPGGYTRVLKLHGYRIGDGGAKAMIAFVDVEIGGNGTPEAADAVKEPKAATAKA